MAHVRLCTSVAAALAAGCAAFLHLDDSRDLAAQRPLSANGAAGIKPVATRRLEGRRHTTRVPHFDAPADVPRKAQEYEHEPPSSKLRAIMEAWHSLPESVRAAETERFLSGLECYVASWDTKHIMDAASGVPEMVPVERALFLQRILLREIAVREPRTAAALTETLAPSFERETLRLEVVLAWADQDWPAAAAWVAQWPDGLVASRDVALRTMTAFRANARPPQTQE